MLCIIIAHFRPGQAPGVYRHFRDLGRLAAEDLRYVAS